MRRITLYKIAFFAAVSCIGVVVIRNVSSKSPNLIDENGKQNNDSVQLRPITKSTTREWPSYKKPEFQSFVASLLKNDKGVLKLRFVELMKLSGDPNLGREFSSLIQAMIESDLEGSTLLIQEFLQEQISESANNDFFENQFLSILADGLSAGEISLSEYPRYRPFFEMIESFYPNSDNLEKFVLYAPLKKTFLSLSLEEVDSQIRQHFPDSYGSVFENALSIKAKHQPEETLKYIQTNNLIMSDRVAEMYIWGQKDHSYVDSLRVFGNRSWESENHMKFICNELLTKALEYDAVAISRTVDEMKNQKCRDFSILTMVDWMRAKGSDAEADAWLKKVVNPQLNSH